MNKNLKTIRIDAGLKQTDICSRLNVSVPTVYKWERGRAPVARRHWSELAALLRVSMDELEKALVETLLDACRERGNIEALKNAVVAGVYRHDLLQDAFSRFGVGYQYPAEPRPAAPHDILEREKRLEYEREIFERDKKIFELEKEVAELRRQLESRLPASISSALKYNQSAVGAERTTYIKSLHSEVKK